MIEQEDIRTAMLIGESGVNKLKNAHIVVFGLGGVGSYTVEALARAGVGALTLVDGDTVSLSNINRQLYALHSTVGQLKTEVAMKRVADIAPQCRVNAVSEFIDNSNLFSCFSDDVTFCVDAIDDTNAKTAIAVYCENNGIPLIASMGTGSKLHPERFMITDIGKTQYCPLCRVMRKKYRDAGLKKVTVLYSEEPPVKNECPDNITQSSGRVPPSSIAFVPSVAGLMIAGYVIRNIIE